MDPLPVGTVGIGGAGAAELKQQISQSNLAGLRAYLARTRNEGDWQDRAFILSLVVPGIRVELLDFACEAEPEAADLALIRCAYLSELAREKRGSSTSDKVGAAKFNDAAACIKAAIPEWDRAARLDPEDPTASACIMFALTIFGELLPLQHRIFHQATTLAPDFVPAYMVMTVSLSARWNGSHDDSLKLARYAMTKATRDSDMAACLFWAHLLIYTHYRDFDKKPKQAVAYLLNPEVVRELQNAFDSWTMPAEGVCRSSIFYLHYAACWFYLVRDRERLRRALSLTGNVFSERPWYFVDTARKIYSDAVSFAEDKPSSFQKEANLEEGAKFAGHGWDEAGRGKLKDAEKAFKAASVMAVDVPLGQKENLQALIDLCWSELEKKKGRENEAAKFRARAVALLDTKPAPPSSGRLARTLALVLHKMGDHPHALIYVEQAIGKFTDEFEPATLANLLHTQGLSYSAIGLHYHAIAPLRSACRIYELNHGDPRFVAVLSSLGNALKKLFPEEAETSYRRAADWYLERNQYESATLPWVNLSTLLLDQKRFPEAEELLNKTLSVRQKISGIAPARIALVLINLAECYGETGRLTEAHATVARAMSMLSGKDSLMDAAYDTQGRIFQWAGDHERAVEWFRKSIGERRKNPGHHPDHIASTLEREITSLDALGRQQEADAARADLASIRSRLGSVPEAELDLSKAKAPMKGAVMIELALGSRITAFLGPETIDNLVIALSRAIREKNAGRYAGSVAVPELTTLIFHTADADALFALLEPVLIQERAAAGARVVIREEGKHREVILPARASMLN